MVPSLFWLRLSLLPAIPIASAGLLPSFVLPVVCLRSPFCAGASYSVKHHHSTDICRSTPGALAPVRVMLSRSIITYLAPSALLAGTSQFRRTAPYMRCPRCAGAPRRPASSSALSLQCSFPACRPLSPRGVCRCMHPVPSRPALAFAEGSQRFGTPHDGRFRDLLVRLCYDLLSCSPPLRRLLLPGFQRFGHPHRRRV